MDKRTGAVVASLVAGLFAANTALAADPGAEKKDSTKTASTKVRCSGINECKGKGECAAEGHACAGHNACKGKGWVTVDSEKACTDKGGAVVAEEKGGKKK